MVCPCIALTAFHNIINSDMELKSPLNFLSQTCIFKLWRYSKVCLLVHLAEGTLSRNHVNYRKWKYFSCYIDLTTTNKLIIQ